MQHLPNHKEYDSETTSTYKGQARAGEVPGAADMCCRNKPDCQCLAPKKKQKYTNVPADPMTALPIPKKKKTLHK